MARRRRGRERRQSCCGFLPNAFPTSFVYHFFELLFILSLVIIPINSSSDLLRGNFTSTSSPPNSSVPSETNLYSLSASEDSAPLLRQHCQVDFNERWPPDPPGPTLVLGFLMSLKNFKIRERLGLKIPGMMSYAVEQINNSSVLPENYTLEVKIRDTTGDEILSTKHVSNMICSNISAIIGPDSSCWVEASIAEAQNIPMISYACTDSKASERKTFARTNPSEIHILRATLATIRHFNWTKFSVIYEGTEFETMAKTLAKLAKEGNITINDEISFSHQSEVPDVFLQTKDRTRIYVLISHRQMVPKVLLTMTVTGLMNANKKEYFLIYVDREEYIQTEWLGYFIEPMDINEMEEEQTHMDLEKYVDRFMVITNTLPRNFDEIGDKAREYNIKKPFCLFTDVSESIARPMPYPRSLKEEVLNSDKFAKNEEDNQQISYGKHVPFLPASYLYDAVILYATAVRELYKDAVARSKKTGEKVDVAAIGRNGTGVAEKLTNMTFSSILGFNVTMGTDRASEGSYSMYYLQHSEDCEDNMFCLVNISDFRHNKLNTDLTIPVKDEPPCGFDGARCVQKFIHPRLITFIVLSTAVVILGFFSIQQYRHWKYEQEISGLIWRIDKEELRFRQNDYLSQSKVSLMSGVSQDGNCANFVPMDRRATYRGTMCCIKSITLENRRQELSRESMKHMRSMREIKHRNVCPFIGAYVEEGKLTLVTEYANRGSLEDILESEDIKLDNLFIASLVQDLLRAMGFLHHSFGPHGNLKSTNCVVSGRWVLQVTDYDLYELRYETFRDLKRAAEDENAHEERKKYIKSFLWKAPELLRGENLAPGTKEGDVYAFGIILHEIIGRKGPFSISDSNGEANIETIVDDVKRGLCMSSGSVRRPNTLDLALLPYGSDPEVLSAMKAAWAEDAKIRPDFKELTARLKKMKKSGNLVDHMVLILEEHNKNLEGLVRERTQEVLEEKKKTEELLHSMLPSSVAMNLCKNIPVEPQTYESVTIYFSDIVGFTALASASSPYEIVSFLDDLYREFDTTIGGFDVYKVETIGDAYMVVSGLPHKNEGRHAGEIASMSLELLQHTKVFKIKHKPDQILKLRIGLHTGPVIAGVVGHTMPRYCLFGDTVNSASRMESNGEPLRIHISEQCRDALTNLGGYVMKKRGLVEMKGKGSVLTYWLIGATEKAIPRVEKSAPTMNFFQRLTDDGRDVRRRSPRLSVDLRSIDRRTPSISSRTRDSNITSSLTDSPQRDFVDYHRRRLNQNHRSNSLESATRGGFLSPPEGTSLIGNRTPSIGSVRESHSFDNIPTKLSTSISPSKEIQLQSSPSSSDPTLAADDAPKVNFCPSARFKDEEVNKAELNPMLDASFQDDSDFELERTDSPSDAKRGSLMKTFFSSLIPKGKRERFSSEKVSLNGLQRENHV